MCGHMAAIPFCTIALLWRWMAARCGVAATNLPRPPRQAYFWRRRDDSQMWRGRNSRYSFAKTAPACMHGPPIPLARACWPSPCVANVLQPTALLGHGKKSKAGHAGQHRKTKITSAKVQVLCAPCPPACTTHPGLAFPLASAAMQSDQD